MPEPINPALSTAFVGGGQIVRIFLENFMSSNNVDVYPGMHLNLIIGPNGSGKSTLLSAVLLCLGGKLVTLKRKSLNDFIMAGKNQCIIEVELYNPAGDNFVIRRIITKNVNTAGESTEFYLNGKSVTKKKIEQLRSQFNIQVDNLCCFLSQERVQDFSTMNNMELLENTEMTVGGGELLVKHQELKNLRTKLVHIQNNIASKEDALSKEKSKNERIKGKVQAIKEKEALCDRVILLNQKKHWLKYDEAKSEGAGILEDLKKAEKNAEKYEKVWKDAEKKLKEIRTSTSTQKEAVDIAKKEENGKRAVMEDRLSRFERQVEDFNTLESKLRCRVQDENDKKELAESKRRNVEKLKNDLESLTKAASTSKQEQVKVDAELATLQKTEVKLSSEKDELDDELMNNRHELRSVQHQKNSMAGVQERKLRELEKTDPNIFRAKKWIDANASRFQGKVVGPIMLEVNVKDASKAKHVENCISHQDMKAFVFEFKDDLNFVINELRNKQEIKGLSCVAAEDALRMQFKPPRTIDSIRKYGFYAYMIDYIEAPDLIIAYLCQSSAIHRVPVGDQRVDSQSSQVPNDINRFFSESRVFSVRVSSYTGERATTVNTMNEPRFLRETIDQNRIAQIENTEQDLLSEFRRIELQKTQKTDQHNEIMQKINVLKAKKRKLAAVEGEVVAVRRRLNMENNELAKHTRSLADPETIAQSFQKEQKALQLKLNRMVDDLHKAYMNLEVARQSRYKIELQFASSRIGIGDIEEAERKGKEEYLQAEQLRQTIHTKSEAFERNLSKIKSRAKELTNGISRTDKAFQQFEVKFATVGNTIDDLDTEMSEAKARAEFLDDGSADLLTEYNTRERNIGELAEECKTLKNEESTQLAEMSAKRQEWLEPVRGVISKVNETFGKHFETMKCAGEVAIAEPADANDYDAYGVCIRVKFWDEMPLQELTRYTQSGGERTVATAIYGLSLQNLTNVPFRFVDEINQGMDARNERNICEMLSSSTSTQSSPQYFYLTPKLMDEFICPDNMAVLCVYNGPAAICTTEWDVDLFLRRANGDADEEDD